MPRRAAIALAFVVWCFLPTWVNLAEGDQTYFARWSPTRAVLVPALWLQGILAIALLGVAELRRRGRMRGAWFDRAFFIACLVPLGAAAVAMVRVLPFDVAPLVRRPFFWPAALAIGAVAGIRAIRRPAAASRYAHSALLYSWPVLAVVIAQAARQSWRFPDSTYADRPLAHSIHKQNPPVRVVWILFDELSEDVAFRQRPPSVHLPAFDALRSRSFFATAARSPSAVTLSSLPALIVGKRVADAVPEGPGELSLSMEGGTRLNWSDAPNVFDAARRMGYDTALVGWYHPYGRLLNRSLTECAWAASWLSPGIEEPTRLQPLGETLLERLRLQVGMFPLAGRLLGLDPEFFARRARLERLSDLLHRAEAFAADPSIGLTLLHLPAPHPPAVYDRAAGRYTAAPGLSYLDGLACADDLLRRIRKAVDDGGVADRTVLLLSSDHGWRPSIWRSGNLWTREDGATAPGGPQSVPFLLHFPNDAAPVEFAAPFDTVVTRDVIEAVLERRIRSSAETAQFLDIRIRSPL